MRRRLARRLRALADRIDYDNRVCVTGFTFTFERYEGMRLRDDGRGCPILYVASDYERAHAESDTHPFGIDIEPASLPQTMKRLNDSEYARLAACGILVDLHDESDVMELIDQNTNPDMGDVDWHAVAAAVIAVTTGAADALRRPGFRERS